MIRLWLKHKENDVILVEIILLWQDVSGSGNAGHQNRARNCTRESKSFMHGLNLLVQYGFLKNLFRGLLRPR